MSRFPVQARSSSSWKPRPWEHRDIPEAPSSDQSAGRVQQTLDKRVKEIAFKAIDLKAEYARIMAQRGESPTSIAGDLTTWLRSVKPKSYVFFAARVINDNDLARVIRFANVAGLVSDAIGVFCFRPVAPDQPTTYQAEEVPSHVDIGRVLFRACQDLTALKDAQPVEPLSPSPAQAASETMVQDESKD